MMNLTRNLITDYDTNGSSIHNQTLKYLVEHFPQILDYVPEDVLEFGIPNRYITVLVALVTSVLLIISLIGNSLMIFLYGRHKSLRTPSNKLVINLAITNFIMHTKSWVMIVNGIYGGPILGGFGCVSFAAFGTASALGEIWSITAIAYERCRAISSPVKAHHLNNSQIMLIIIGIWSISIIATILPAFGIGAYVADTYLLVCVFDTWSHDTGNRIYVYGLIVFAWLIPLAVITICYLKIFVYTHGTRTSVNIHTDSSQQNTPSSSLKNNSNRERKKEPFKYKDYLQSEMFVVERRLASRLFKIILIWVIGWTPFASIALLQMIGYGHKIDKYVNLGAMLFCKSCSVVNACLYGMRLPKFRKRIIALLSCMPSNEFTVMETAATTRRLEIITRKQVQVLQPRDSILHNHSTRFNKKKGVRFQLDDLSPTQVVHNQQSDQKTKQNKSSASLEKTQIKFQVKEAYVMKGGRKEFKNVLILCETRDGKIEIGWSNRAEDSPFRRHSM